MSKQREIVESIRQKEYLIGVEGAGALRRNLHNALRLLSDDLYASQTHFVLELIQNADDNEYGPGLKPCITFHIEPERIVVVNNELGFLEANVRALCQVGQSTKTRKRGFIGEKGIGFKSVFTVSDTPEIHSNGFQFRFDVSNKDELLGYVVPNWIDSATEATPPDNTSIVLPAKSGSQFDRTIFQGIEGELLLFLRHLRVIEVVDAAQGTTERFERDQDGDSLTIHRHLSSHGKEAAAGSCRYILCKRDVDFSDVQEEKRQGLDKTEVVLAFPVDCDHHAMADNNQRVFAFLPIRPFGFRFLIQGDFLLNSSREDILRARPWNQRVRDSIAPAFIDALAGFRAHGGLSHTFYRYLPKKADISDTFFEPVAEQLYESLRQTDSMLTASGQWKRPDQVLIRDASCARLVSNNDLMALLSKEYLSDDVEADDEVLKTLGCRSFGVSDLIKCLRDSAWVSRRANPWFQQLFSYLSRKTLSEAHRETLAKLPLFPLANGQKAAISDGVIFLPMASGLGYGFEDELRVLASGALPKERDAANSVLDCLRTLGLKDAAAADIIDLHILPLHSSDQWKECAPEALLGHIAYVKDHLEEYVDTKTMASEYMSNAKRREAHASLSATLWVRTTKQDGDKTYYAHVGDMYLGNDYLTPYPLEKVFAGCEGVSFVAADYARAKGQGRANGDTTVSAWATFFKAMGAHTCPRVLVSKASGVGTLKPRTWPKTAHGYTCQDWVPSPECRHAMESQNPALLRQIVNIFDKEWDAYYGRCLTGNVYGSYRGSTSESCASTFATALRQMQVPTAGRELARFCETYLDTAELRDVFGSKVPYLKVRVESDGLLRTVGVISKVDADTALRALRQWQEYGKASLDAVKRMYRVIELHAGSNAKMVSDAFAAEPLVFMPGRHEAWLRSSQVSWVSHGHVLDSVVPSLRTTYGDFRSFFIGTIGVQERLTPERLIKALSEVTSTERPPEEFEQAARRVYADLEAALRSQGSDVSLDEPPPWADQLKHGLLWTHKQEFWQDEGDLFVNDMPELGDLFKNRSTVAFFGVEPSAVPRLDLLIRACELRRLSACVQQRLPDNSQRSIHLLLTRRIRQRWLHVARYLYARENAHYEKLVPTQTLKRLRDMTVYVVPCLQLTVMLNAEEAQMRADAVAEDHNILVDAALGDDPDRVAVELAKMVSARPQTAATFISLVLGAADISRVDRVFHNHNIPDLPAAERERLTTALSLTEDGEEQEAVVIAPTESDDPEGPPVSSTTTVEADTAKDRSEPATIDDGGHVPAPAPAGAQETAVTPSAEPVQDVSTVPQEPGDKPTMGARVMTSVGDGPSDHPAQHPSADGARQPFGKVPETTLGPASKVDGQDTAKPAAHPDQGSTSLRSSDRTRHAAGRTHRDRGSSNSRRDLVPVYVAPEGGEANEDDDLDDDDDANEGWRITLGKLAVESVCADEEACGWHAHAMSQTHKGYDVESTKDGQIKYIEVKGLRGEWTERGVGLTIDQFEYARNYQEKFWLYVVEFADSPDKLRITRIQNPAARITQYRFIDSWRQLAVKTEQPAGTGPQSWEGREIRLDENRQGRILVAQAHGQLTRLHVELPDGTRSWLVFNPGTMSILDAGGK